MGNTNDKTTGSQKITPFLWFDGQAQEAMNFYTSIFRNSRKGNVSRYGDGTILSATFWLEGLEFSALNGGPHYKFSPATSFFVHCKDQEEVDEYWDKLLDGGEALQCGWITDKFGVTWQIIPDALGRLLGDPNREKAGRVMQAMMKMVKIDVEGLERAYEGS